MDRLGGFRASWGATSQGSLAVRPDRRQFLRNAALGAVGSVLALLGAATGLLLWPQQDRRLRQRDHRARRGCAAGRGAAATAISRASSSWCIAPMDCWRSTRSARISGCTVPWVGPPDSPNAFQCPCHGSMYDYVGVRTGGPAPRPMDYMAVRVDEATGNVTVDTGDINQRLDYSPEQAVPYPVVGARARARARS